MDKNNSSEALNYVRTQRNLNVSEAEIIAQLKTSGWPETEARELLSATLVSADHKPQVGKWKYPGKRLLAVIGISLFLTIASAFIPFAMQSDGEYPASPIDPAGPGCRCKYYFGGFPIPFSIYGIDLYKVSGLFPSAQAVDTNAYVETYTLILDCTPGCSGFSSFIWQFIVADLLLLFLPLYFADYYAAKTGRRHYWALLVFLIVYLGIYYLTSIGSGMSIDPI